MSSPITSGPSCELDSVVSFRQRLESVIERRPPGRAARIVAAGGGTGVPAVLAGIAGRRLRSGAPVEVAAVVTTADDGGSSGAIREQDGIPAPGDVRNCLVALAPQPSPLADLFQHRFVDGALAGHTVGNLLLAALTRRLGDFEAAVGAAAGLLGARGRVLPCTSDSVNLVAMLDDGRVVRGETAIPAAHGRVHRLRLDRAALPSRAAVEALADADVVVLGPGSLYSSVLASLLVDGLADALRACRGFRVLVVNLFTEPGETDGYTAADHVRAIQRHLGPVVDVALVHGAPFPPEMVERYAAEGAAPVAWDRDALADLGVATLAADLLGPGPKARHDSSKLGAVLLDLASGA